jgi:KaiC/GvpD/RAD55 family RecA-like ATPase
MSDLSRCENVLFSRDGNFYYTNESNQDIILNSDLKRTLFGNSTDVTIRKLFGIRSGILLFIKNDNNLEELFIKFKNGNKKKIAWIDGESAFCYDNNGANWKWNIEKQMFLTNSNEQLYWDENKQLYWNENEKLYLNKEQSFYVLKTGISPVYKSPVNNSVIDSNPEFITESEFDDLLNGGIYVPKKVLDKSEKKNHGIVILLTGAPGSGKTTFALEFCESLAKRQSQIKKLQIQKSFSSFYITNEDTRENLRNKIQKWKANAEISIAEDDQAKFYSSISKINSLVETLASKENEESKNKESKNQLDKFKAKTLKDKLKYLQSTFGNRTEIDQKINDILDHEIKKERTYIIDRDDFASGKSPIFLENIIEELLTNLDDIGLAIEYKKTKEEQNNKVLKKILSRLDLDVRKTINSVERQALLADATLVKSDITAFINRINDKNNARDKQALVKEALKESDDKIKEYKNKLAEYVDICNHSIVVIDSLNSLIDCNPESKDQLSEEERYKRYTRVINSLACNFPISIILMDTGPGFSPEHKWSPAEYAADLEINFSYERPENYMIRRLWIVKARYQQHADGFHRIKIDPCGNMLDIKPYATSYFKEGGIHVFSSIHRYLSDARKKLDDNPNQSNKIPTPYPALSASISSEAKEDDGIRIGQCVCIVGERGTMKSYLAYRLLLESLYDEKQKENKALIISLRDQKNQVYDQLLSIVQNQNIDYILPTNVFSNQGNEVKNELKKKIEVLYYWPGYISPDEFIHIVKVAAQDDNIKYVVINGLEQLPARFPLCAQEKMFISGLIAYLTSLKKIVVVTSSGKIDKPANDGGVPDGLLPMGDIILQGSVVDIHPRNIWNYTPNTTSLSDQTTGANPEQIASQNPEQNNNDIKKDLWSSAVRKEYWDITEANQQTSTDASQATSIVTNEQRKIDHSIDRARKLHKLYTTLEIRDNDLVQPHVVYDIVRGATGFRECRMRLLCYVTRRDDRSKAIEKALTTVCDSELRQEVDRNKWENIIKEIAQMATNDSTIGQVSRIISNAQLNNSINVNQISERIVNELKKYPRLNQVFFSRIPEEIATQIFRPASSDREDRNRN